GRTVNQSGSGTESRAQQDPGAGPAPSGDNALPEPNIQDRKIVRNANLELRVDSVTTAVQQIDDVAAGAGGFVSASNVFVNSASDGEDTASRTQTATLTVRVPADAYPTVMSRLRGISKETVSETRDRKSTRLNSSHVAISYAVFCLKKKKKTDIILVDRCRVAVGG